MRTIDVGPDAFDQYKGGMPGDPYRFRWCDGGRRVAVWIEDPEHGLTSVQFADAATGAIAERPDELADVGDPETDDSGYDGYRGYIELCRGGDRLVYRCWDSTGWHYRDRGPDGWADAGPFLTRLRDAAGDGVSVHCRLAASADGATVVMVGDRIGARNGKRVRDARAEV